MCLQWRSRGSSDLPSDRQSQLQSQSVVKGCLGTAFSFQLREMVITRRHQRLWGKYSRINNGQDPELLYIQSYNDLHKLYSLTSFSNFLKVFHFCNITINCKLPLLIAHSEIGVVMSIHRYFDGREWYIRYNDPILLMSANAHQLLASR